jgi:hypothetical protein
MFILYAYKLFLKFSSEYIHPNYFFIVLNAAIEFVLIYRLHPVVPSFFGGRRNKNLKTQSGLMTFAMVSLSGGSNLARWYLYRDRIVRWVYDFFLPYHCIQDTG